MLLIQALSYEIVSLTRWLIEYIFHLKKTFDNYQRCFYFQCSVPTIMSLPASDYVPAQPPQGTVFTDLSTPMDGRAMQPMQQYQHPQPNMVSYAMHPQEVMCQPKPQQRRKSMPKKRRARTQEEKLEARQKKQEKIQDKKRDARKKKHRLLPPCKDCRKKCSGKFTEEHRFEINDKYWNLSLAERRLWLDGQIVLMEVKQRKKARKGKSSFCVIMDKNDNTILLSSMIESMIKSLVLKGVHETHLLLSEWLIAHLFS